MFKTIHKSKVTPVIAFLLMFMFAGSGCSYFKDEAYYGVNIEEVKDYKGPEGSPSDQDVVAFMNHVKTALRMHMKWSRVARIVSSSTQVLTAAAATAMVGLSYGSQEVIGILAGTSAVMPNLQAIFQAKERALAYNEGLTLIEEAESDFRRAIVKPNVNEGEKRDAGKVDTKRMTVDGAELYTRILASIKLVETALVQQIPSIDQMKAAVGEIKQVKLSQGSITLPEKDEGNVMLLAGGPIESVNSTNISVVTAAPDTNNKNKVVLSAKKEGNAEVTVVNRKGDSASIQVTVTAVAATPPAPIPPAPVVP